MTRQANDQDVRLVKAGVANLLAEDTPIENIPVYVDSIAEVVLGITLSEEQRSNLIAVLESSQSFKMGLGLELVSRDHRPWLESRQDSIDWKRWLFYATYLRSEKSMNAGVLNIMDKRNSRILDLAGDPQEPGRWSRKGLVIGDVQSGKTSNYLALLNKAADAGYRIFILLAGDKERLRAQTQERVDEGFIGRDSKLSGRSGAPLLANKNIIGVGKNPGFIHATSATSYAQDFTLSKTGQIQNLNDTDVPHVFVIKKHKDILNNLATFLEASGAGPNQKIQAPLLLIDDEADYASIDTSKADADPTVINSSIRRVLAAFDRSSYVGFTATPFANVLIDDEDESDLFPRDFVFSLESPSNYFGPREMFDETSKKSNFIVPLQDAEDYFPSKHRKSLTVSQLPGSLDDAILAFYLANAIRDLRPGQARAPRSMLVHVSRFKDVQRQVFDLVVGRCSEINSILQLGIGARELFSDLHRVYLDNFEHVQDVTWDKILKQLPSSAQPIEVFIVNSDKANSDWTRAFDGPTPRVIAIGGDVLSRGLTLEGLTISYFYRRSLAYDTVMQMGRWFGYRDGFRDVCKLWIDPEVAVWFLEIAEALDELRGQLEQMHIVKETPETYGLAVRCHPRALLTVTSLNKMRAGEKRPIRVSLWGTNPETIKFVNDPKILQSNLSAAEKLVSEISDLNLLPITGGKLSWRAVPQKYIAEFFRNYVAPRTEVVFGGDEFSKFIGNMGESRLSTWDVLLQTGSGDPQDFSKFRIKPLIRAFGTGTTDQNTLIVGMGKSRLGSYGDIKMALSDKSRNALPQNHTPTSAYYAEKLDRPLLILYPIKADTNKRREMRLKFASPRDFEGLVLGVGLAFPSDGGIEQFASGPEYVLNRVFQRTNSTLFDLDDLEEVDDE